MDPLAQLKDIHLPEQIHNYPLAPGWWIVFILSILLVIFAIRKAFQYRKARVVKKQIINALGHSTTIEQTSELLKLALLNYFPRQQTANLYGNSLYRFLIEQLPASKQARFKQLTSYEFDSIYQANNKIEINEFNQSIAFWLSHALPPKASLKQGGNDD